MHRELSFFSPQWPGHVKARYQCTATPEMQEQQNLQTPMDLAGDNSLVFPSSHSFFCSSFFLLCTPIQRARLGRTKKDVSFIRSSSSDTANTLSGLTALTCTPVTVQV